MKTRYPNVTINPDRHGKLRARFRKAGCKPQYMKHLPDQKGFKEEYEMLTSGEQVKAPRFAVGTVHDLIERYYRCADFRAKGNDATRKTRRGIIESFRAEYGHELVGDFGFEHIEAILLARAEKRFDEERKRWLGGQVAASNLREELLRLFRYAKKLRLCTSNPVEEAERVGKQKLEGYYSWTEADIAKYKKKHDIGTKARLALEILLWTGQRRGDASKFGRRHIVRGKINYRASKNDADLWLPMAPDLQRAIDAMTVVGTETFLLTDYGKPFTVSGFGNKMREWCNDAGLPKCTAHGLRKAIARRAAQAEATQQGIKAVGGWKHDSEVRTYTAAAEQERLADDAMGRVIDQFSGD